MAETLGVVGYVRASTNKQDISPELQELAATRCRCSLAVPPS